MKALLRMYCLDKVVYVLSTLYGVRSTISPCSQPMPDSPDMPSYRVQTAPSLEAPRERERGGEGAVQLAERGCREFRDKRDQRLARHGLRGIMYYY